MRVTQASMLLQQCHCSVPVLHWRNRCTSLNHTWLFVFCFFSKFSHAKVHMHCMGNRGENGNQQNCRWQLQLRSVNEWKHCPQHSNLLCDSEHGEMDDCCLLPFAAQCSEFTMKTVHQSRVHKVCDCMDFFLVLSKDSFLARTAWYFDNRLLSWYKAKCKYRFPARNYCWKERVTVAHGPVTSLENVPSQNICMFSVSFFDFRVKAKTLKFFCNDAPFRMSPVYTHRQQHQFFPVWA